MRSPPQAFLGQVVDLEWFVSERAQHPVLGTFWSLREVNQVSYDQVKHYRSRNPPAFLPLRPL